MSAKKLLDLLLEVPTMNPAPKLIENYLSNQEHEDWKAFLEEYEEEDEVIGEDPYITEIKLHHGPRLRMCHARLERARKAGTRGKTEKAANEMEALIERYIESVDGLDPAIRETMLLIEPHDPVAPDYIAQHLVDPIHLPRSWATGIGSTIGKKTSKRDKFIQFLEMVTGTDTDVPLAELIANMSDNVAVHTPATFDFNKPRKQWSHELFDNPKKK